jgi:hypothetical protein
MHASSNCASPARRPATSGNHSLLQPHTRRSHPIISLPPPIHPCIHSPDLIKHVVVKVRHEIRSWENEKSCRKGRKRIYKKARVSVHPATFQTITSITFRPLDVLSCFFFLSIESRSITFRFDCAYHARRKSVG